LILSEGHVHAILVSRVNFSFAVTQD